MTIAYKLVGYDKRTERAVLEVDLGVDVEREVRRRVAVTEDTGSVPLSVALVTRVTQGLIGNDLYVSRFDWFLEPFAVETRELAGASSPRLEQGR